MQNNIVVGVVLKAQGIRGELKVKPLTDEVKRFDHVDEVIVKPKQGDNEVRRITKRRYDPKGDVFLCLEGINDRNMAEALKGAQLAIMRNQAVELATDEWFMDDLIGCQVQTDQAQQLGTVTDILETGSNEVLVISGEHGEILIPMLKAVIEQIDIKNEYICVYRNQLEGLLPDGF